MIRGLNLEATRVFTSKFDTDDEKTEFDIGVLDSRVLGKILDTGTTYQVDPSRPDDEVETAVNTNAVNAQVVAYGLKGFRRLKDARGNDIKFETDERRHSGTVYNVVKPHVIAQIPLAVVAELAAEIRKDNELTVAEKKD